MATNLQMLLKDASEIQHLRFNVPNTTRKEQNKKTWEVQGIVKQQCHCLAIISRGALPGPTKKQKFKVFI